MTSARGERFLDLVAVMDQLRSPDGCPWDARQTHASLVEYLVEETYELVEAIDTSDDAGVREELGDLLLQVVFHARIAQENLDDPWDIDAVC
ncbi:MAG: nucleoside triphosphate pyrophosphohydrolase, partial [Actinobacteria bacterium]|nr:nucleoside triphosphate pyrophosphohydrolase [Actinomycetota bacterium]